MHSPFKRNGEGNEFASLLGSNDLSHPPTRYEVGSYLSQSLTLLCTLVHLAPRCLSVISIEPASLIPTRMAGFVEADPEECSSFSFVEAYSPPPYRGELFSSLEKLHPQKEGRHQQKRPAESISCGRSQSRCYPQPAPVAAKFYPFTRFEGVSGEGGLLFFSGPPVADRGPLRRLPLATLLKFGPRPRWPMCLEKG